MSKKKKEKDFLKKYTAKITAKKIAKSNKMQVHIPNKPVEDVLRDPNRFFKDEYEQERRNLFLR
jgi:hypothetical protein